MAKTVTRIPATAMRPEAGQAAAVRKRRAAGYARVSTDREEQATSYEAQMRYYKEYIENRPDMEFAGMYSDEGISATSTAHRDGFNRMVSDALAGKIDLIITKSVSRFARNTVDSLTTIRRLKESGVEVYFEKENIWTMDAKGELLITIMSSLAQEESRSISENTTWGQRKRFADGKASVGYGRFLGYDKGFSVNGEQAETVRLIYKLFLEGFSCYAVAKELTERGIPTPAGREVWHPSTVKSILTNEKYKGDALLQKGFTVDFLTKKRKKNDVEVPQYYVEGDHEAIIEPAVFDSVQAEMERRLSGNGRYSGVSIFSSKIKCGECGCWFGAKVWHSTDKYRKVIYRCNHKYDGDGKCSTPHVTEDEVKNAFVRAANELLTEKDELAANARQIADLCCGTEELERRMAELEGEMEAVAELAGRCITENAGAALDQDEYNAKYGALAERYDCLKAEHDAAAQAVRERDARRQRMERFAADIEGRDAVTEFDGSLWSSLADFVTVYEGKRIVVTFRDGTEIEG